MEVPLTPQQEAHLYQMAKYAGKTVQEFLKDSVSSLLEEDDRFRAAVRRGIAQAERGEFIDEEEMEARIERMLNS